MSPSHIRRFINLWPPLLFSGIRVTSISKDWRHVVVQLRLHWWNRNAVGTMFGGSLFAMTDPFYPLMLQHNLGADYAVWVKSADVEFVAPGRSVAVASFELTGDEIAEIRAATEGSQSATPRFAIAIREPCGKLIANTQTSLHVRRKRSRDASG